MMRMSRAVAVVLMTGIVAVAAVTICRAEVAVTRAPGPWVASGADYRVTIGDDGNVTSLMVGGVEFLEHTTEIPQGSCFWDGDALRLSGLRKTAPNVLAASSERVSIQYEFSEESMVWSVTNKTDDGMPFFLVFHPGVEAVVGDGGELRLTCVNEKWAETTWFRGEAQLTIAGSDAQWGPWKGRTQMS